jgi:hypothetical protein
MAKNGFITKPGLEDALALALGHGKKSRQKRDNSLPQKEYNKTLKQINNVLQWGIKEAASSPEIGIMVALECAKFVMETMPDPSQDARRATSISQFKILEDCFARVRQPENYLEDMQKKFGLHLDPRSYPAGSDGFSTIINSQKDRLQRESQGFNSPEEKTFCTHRRTLLSLIEKGYNKLRDQALGILEKPAE